MSNCPFCEYAGPSEVLDENSGAYVIEPIDPVTPGHVLVVPKTHTVSWVAAICLPALMLAQDYAYENPELYEECNLIASVGPTATQTVFHAHFHIVPRREGDGLQLPWSAKASPPIVDRSGT